MPYSQLSLPRSKLSQRASYNHQIDAYQQNSQTQRLCSKFKSSLFRIRQLRSKTHIKNPSKVDNDYNKYYIKPQLRYKKKTHDPKLIVLEANSNAKQTYFYDNLHNQQFWQWRHPFEKHASLHNRKSIQDKVNAKILQQFKQHIEDSGYSRLPLVVRSVLERKI